MCCAPAGCGFWSGVAGWRVGSATSCNLPSPLCAGGCRQRGLQQCSRRSSSSARWGGWRRAEQRARTSGGAGVGSCMGSSLEGGVFCLQGGCAPPLPRMLQAAAAAPHPPSKTSPLPPHCALSRPQTPPTTGHRRATQPGSRARPRARLPGRRLPARPQGRALRDGRAAGGGAQCGAGAQQAHAQPTVPGARAPGVCVCGGWVRSCTGGRGGLEAVRAGSPEAAGTQCVLGACATC